MGGLRGYGYHTNAPQHIKKSSLPFRVSNLLIDSFLLKVFGGLGTFLQKVPSGIKGQRPSRSPYSLLMISSVMALQPMGVAPLSPTMSAVRMPSASTLSMAASMQLASSLRSKA